MSGKSRGSAYVFVLIMSLSLFLMLAIAASATVFEVLVSNATQKYSNLSLLAHSGIERTLLAINSRFEADRADINKRTTERMTSADDYTAIFIEEAISHINPIFTGTELTFNLALHNDEGPDDSYSVTVRISPVGGTGRLALNSVASKDGLPTNEQVSAEITCAGTAFIREYGDNYLVAESDIGWRIQKLAQKR